MASTTRRAAATTPNTAPAAPMANPPSNRRRKRSSESGPAAWWKAKDAPQWALLLLASGCILALLSSYPGDDGAAVYDGRRQLRSMNGDVTNLADRRDRVLDVGLEENVWRRQLRARRERNGGRRMKSMADEVDGGAASTEERPMRRMALIPRYTDKHHFEECVGKTIDECQIIIDSYVSSHPDDFNNQTSLLLDVRKIREVTDMSYYKVVLRTNVAGDKVLGIFDDGVVHYPWPWRVNGVDMKIGPWDCQQGGTMMDPAECCSMIQADVTEMDDNNKYLACFVEEPVGGPNNPERQDRAIVVTDGTGKVVRAPVAH